MSNEVIQEKYRKAEVYMNGYGWWRLYSFKGGKTFDELKEYVAEAFYKGVSRILFYPDYRKKSNYLEIKKDHFDTSFQEQCFKDIQRRERIEKLESRINTCKDNIKWNENRITEIEAEIFILKTNNHE